jgi:hypothetical protein
MFDRVRMALLGAKHSRRQDPLDVYSVGKESFDHQRPIAFMHFPKTSGTSLTQGLLDALKPRRPLLGNYDRAIFGGFNSFDSLPPEQRKKIHLDPSTMPQDIDFVAGHLAFSTLSERLPTFQLVTFIREPISRIISHWLFFRGLSDEALQAWEPFSDVIRIARSRLEVFLSSAEIACQIDNVYTRMLLWPHDRVPDHGFLDPAFDGLLVAEAAGRLLRFQYVDVIENPNFHINLQAWLGRHVLYPRLNETPLAATVVGPLLRDELSLPAFARLRDLTRLDSILWKTLSSARVAEVDADTLQLYTQSKNIVRAMGPKLAS